MELKKLLKAVPSERQRQPQRFSNETLACGKGGWIRT
jgi:hypothetical protein